MIATNDTVVEDLKENLAGAQQRQRALVQESRNLPNELREASRRVAKERAASAREGEAGSQLLAVASERDVEELRTRERSLPLEIWSHRLVVLEIDRDLHAAELEAVEAELKNTGPAYQAARQDLALAEQRMAQAYSAHASAAATADTLRLKLRGAKEAVAELEGNAPGA